MAAGGAGSSAGSSNASGGGASVGAQVSSDKLDVLFVIDNSVSMLGKQKILAKSLPRFVSRLTNPLCVDDQGSPTVDQPTLASAACSSGAREFSPIADIHFGVITTSIGSAGGDVCTNQTAALDQQDDQAQLLPSKRTGVASYQDSGFLSYDASGAAGVNDAAALGTSLSEMVTASGERGCGYEAPLEAMYRFLVDPEPPVSVEVVSQKSTPTGVNDTLLAQRAAFLRPDSSLAVVVFSDENDCSIKDSEQGWLVGSSRLSTTQLHMPRATSICETDPNDPCCRSCAESESLKPDGCAPLAEDSVCSVIPAGQAYASYDTAGDSLNLRCFEQKRRFGFDFLQPVERYSDALSNPKIKNRAGTLVDNPLFAERAGKGPRSATLISVSVIVGAPWQDLATVDSSSGGPLEYLDAAGLESAGRWPMLIGDKQKNVPPSDPFMIESITPRMGKNPVTMFSIAPETSTNPQQNPINGHESNNFDNWDLQHACIFPLAEPVACTAGSANCDCAPNKENDFNPVLMENNALCQPPGGGPPQPMQYFGKAYPGTRELTFARQMGARAVAASMCPRNATDATRADYGYGPALDSLTKRIAQTLK